MSVEQPKLPQPREYACHAVECGATFSHLRVSCGAEVPPSFCPQCGGAMSCHTTEFPHVEAPARIVELVATGAFTRALLATDDLDAAVSAVLADEAPAADAEK